MKEKLKNILTKLKTFLKNTYKTLKYKLQLYDFLWSVPLGFAAFLFCGVFLQLLDNRSATYDPGFIQALFLSSTLVIAMNALAILGLLFTFRGIFRYIFGYKDKITNQIINHSKEDWKNITSWQRLRLSLFVFFYYLVVEIVVFKMFY